MSTQIGELLRQLQEPLVGLGQHGHLIAKHLLLGLHLLRLNLQFLLQNVGLDSQATRFFLRSTIDESFEIFFLMNLMFQGGWACFKITEIKNKYYSSKSYNPVVFQSSI